MPSLSRQFTVQDGCIQPNRVLGRVWGPEDFFPVNPCVRHIFSCTTDELMNRWTNYMNWLYELNLDILDIWQWTVFCQGKVCTFCQCAEASSHWRSCSTPKLYIYVCRWKGILAIRLLLGKLSKNYVSLLSYSDNVFNNGNVIYNLKTVIPRPRW